MTKICGKCKLDKSRNEFYTNSSRKDNLDSYCKTCRRAQVSRIRAGQSDRQSAYLKEWYLKNKASHYEKNFNYKKRRYKEDLDFRIAHCLRVRLNSLIRGPGKAGSAVRDLGCSVEKFREHLEARFKPGMTWDNYGEWHIDHIKPLSSFDLRDRDQFVAACHFSNLQPLWASENLSKGRRITNVI